jgi:hypothetical protein
MPHGAWQIFWQAPAPRAAQNTTRSLLTVVGAWAVSRGWSSTSSVPAAWGHVGRRYVWTDGQAYAYRQRKMREIRTGSAVG